MRMSGLLLVSLAMVVLGSGAHARPSAPSNAASDVRLVAETIESVHPDPFRSIPRQTFESEVNDLVRRAPTLSRNELLRVIASLGARNGHTGLFPLDPGHRSELHLYPLRLYDFADGVFVVDEAGDLGVVGSRLIAIEGMPLERVLDLVRPLVPHDNPSNVRGLAPHFALVSEVLEGLHVTDGSGRVEFTFERPGRERVTVDLDPISAREYGAAFADPHYGHYPSILPAAPRPLYLASSAKEMWARTLAGGRAVYMGYNVVASPPDAFLRKITRLVSRRSVRWVIVDVRRNGGGDDTTYGALMTLFETPRVNRAGRLYLLVGRATFSAAANFAAEIDRATRATIVGEPTGGGVETYGDVTQVVLPTTAGRSTSPRASTNAAAARRTVAWASRRTFGST
jgi:Peptidase family S41